MSPACPVHEIRVGKVRASIWEERRGRGHVRESDYRVSIGCEGERAAAARTCFETEELAVVADVSALAHLWIQEQVCSLD